MKKFLSVFVVLAIVLSVGVASAASVTATPEQPAASQPAKSGGAPLATTHENSTVSFETKAKAICTTRGLTGVEYDECVKTETANLTKTNANR